MCQESIANLRDEVYCHTDHSVDMKRLCAGSGGRKLNFFAMHLNSNMSTSIPHTECDTTYTIIGVPNQKDKPNLRFCMTMTETTKLWLSMDCGDCHCYSAYLMTHSQKCNSNVKHGNINISAYSPKRFWENYCTTYKRLIS